MPRFVPDWPILMTPRTAASYLDCAQDETGNLKRTFKQWRDMEGFPTDALTVEVMFSSSQTNVGDGTPLFSYAASNGSDNEVLLWLEGASGKLNVFLAGQKINTGISNASLLDGEPHQVSVTWDQASNELKVYIDGDSAFATTINIRDLRAGGTLALGLFYDNDVATNIAALATGLSRGAQTMVQLKGVLAVGTFTFVLSIVFWYAIKIVAGIRVSADEEMEGLDIGEHGNRAYPDFATHDPSYSAALPASPELSPLASQKPAVAKY